MLILINTPLIWLKLFRFLCVIKLIFDLLPLFNPYNPPLALISFITRIYYKFWAKIIPGIYLGEFKYDLYPIVGFEALNELIKFLEFIREILISHLL